MQFISSIKQRFWAKLKGKRISSKQLVGINPLFNNVDFAVNLPSKWNGFFIILQFPVFFLLAFLALACGCTVISSGIETMKDFNEGSVCAFFLFLIIFWIVYTWIISKTIKSIRKIRRYALNPLTALFDNRHPVLFLRSFSVELEDDFDRADQQTPEEILVKVLDRVGPVITVGNPGEEGLPILGAKRIYIEQDWKQNVLKLCMISKVVIIDADITNGVRWEMRNVRNAVNPRQLLISFLSKQLTPDYSTDPLFNQSSFERFYQKFSDVFVEAFDCPLPAYNPNIFLICFDDNWNPYPIIIYPETNRSIFKLNVTARKPKKYIRISITAHTLAPFFSNLDALNRYADKEETR